MSIFNPFAIGFVFVAAGSVVGVDYVVQSKNAGSHPGEYSFVTYLDSYGIRVDETIAFVDKFQRQSVEARTHLPMEPAGWERVEWDIGAIDMDELTRGMGIVERMEAKGERSKAIALANYEAWEYRKGDQIVRISASFNEEPEASETVIAGQLTGTFFPIEYPQYRQYKSIGDVSFLSVTDARQPKKVTQTLLEARLGNEILIAVAADAEEDALLDLLYQIDIDSLNLMLPEPLPHLLEGAAPLTHGQQMTLAGFEARALNEGEPLSRETIAEVLTGALTYEPEDQNVAALEAEPAEAASEPKPAAKRVQLSGGRSCIGEDSKLCN